MNILDKHIEMIPSTYPHGAILMLSKSIYEEHKHLFVRGKYKGFKVKMIN